MINLSLEVISLQTSGDEIFRRLLSIALAKAREKTLFYTNIKHGNLHSCSLEIRLSWRCENLKRDGGQYHAEIGYSGVQKRFYFIFCWGQIVGKEAGDMRFDASEDIYFSNWCNLE